MAAIKRNLENKPSKTKTPRDILVSALGYRGLEVLETAEKQFPHQTSIFVPRIAQVISSGAISKIDGGQLLQILHMLGIPVRLQTSIRVEKDGKLVSLSERLGSGSS